MPTARELHELIKTRDFRDFVIEEAKQDNETALSVMDRMEEINCDSLVLLAYLSIAECMEAYPEVVSMKPTWKPFVEDKQLTNRFRVEMETCVDRGTEKSEYGYDNPPACVAEGDDAAFSFMVECCENIHSNVWDKFAWCPLNEEKCYTSAEQVRAESREATVWFSTRLEEWLMQRNTVEAATKAGRRPGL